MDFHFSFFRALSVFQAGRKCRFFQWRDDEICEHGKVLIPQQRQRIIKLEKESFIEVLMCWKTSVSHFMDSRQPWQKVLWLSKLLGISIWVFCFTGVRFFCLNSSLVVEVYFSIFLWFIIKCLVCISSWAKV